jgi:hypothetical protein
MKKEQKEKGGVCCFSRIDEETGVYHAVRLKSRREI